MRVTDSWVSVGVLSAVVALLLLGCKETPVIGGPVDREGLIDGVYEGSYKGGPNSAVVRVSIENKRITCVEIVEHSAWKGKKAEPIIPKRIIESQSTHVDAVGGATNSSRVLMNAVHKAIEKAYESSP